MKRKTVLIVSLVGLVLLALIGYLYFHYVAGSAGTPPWRVEGVQAASSASQDKPVTVRATQIYPITINETISAVGSPASNESVILSPEIAGRISQIDFEDGGTAKKGQVLIQLDSSTQKAEVDQAKANADLARINDRRTRELANRNFVSQNAVDETRYKLKVAEADLALAQAKYQKTIIRAPFDGMLGIRRVSVGDYVQPGDALVNIEDIHSLNIDFQVPEIWLQRLNVGLGVVIESDALPNEKRTAIIRAIDPQIHKTSRSFSVRARLMNPDHRLKPGMFVRVTVNLGYRVDALMVPEASISSIGTDQFVYEIVDGKAVRKNVLLGLRQNGKVEVVSGLKPRAVVVVAGHQKLRDNQSVVIQKTSNESSG